MRRSTFLVSRIGDPHRRSPNKLAVLLLTADIVIALPAPRWDHVAPSEINRLLAGLCHEDVLVIFYDGDFGEWRGSIERYLQLRIGGRAEGVAHDLLATGDLSQYYIGGRIHVAFLECIKDSFPRGVLCQHIRVAQVR